MRLRGLDDSCRNDQFCRLDLCPGGAFEMYFNPDAPEGQRGGEGYTILAIEEMRLLSFT